MSVPFKCPIIAALIVRRGDEILLLKRTGTGLFDGEWAFVGGKVDAGESPREAIIREAREEIGLTLDPNFKMVQSIINPSIETPGTTWQDLTFIFDVTLKDDQIPINMEPGKHGEMTFFKRDNLPSPLLFLVTTTLESIAQGKTYGEICQR